LPLVNHDHIVPSVPAAPRVAPEPSIHRSPAHQLPFTNSRVLGSSMIEFGNEVMRREVSPSFVPAVFPQCSHCVRAPQNLRRSLHPPPAITLFTSIEYTSPSQRGAFHMLDLLTTLFTDVVLRVQIAVCCAVIARTENARWVTVGGLEVLDFERWYR